MSMSSPSIAFSALAPSPKFKCINNLAPFLGTSQIRCRDFSNFSISPLGAHYMGDRVHLVESLLFPC
jgi:hypothetical protein